MSNGTDSKYRSRKFRLAVATLAIVAVLGGHGQFALAATAGDTALVLGAMGSIFSVILKLYNDANLQDKNGG
jgi:membrane associated rhomboid family serine protease